MPADRTSYQQDKVLTLTGARGNNLNNVDLTIPLGLMTCVTGVSGSGKSTLINRTLYPLAATALNGATTLKASEHDGIEGLKQLDKVVDIDQSPIGRTPRSNPATYTGIFTPVRELFAGTQEARSRGYKAGRFSFNVKGGVARLVRATVLLRSKCTSWLIFMCPVMYVKANATIAKHWIFDTKVKIFTKCWI